MSALLQGIAVLLGAAVLGLAATALAAGYRAVRIGGSSLLFDGMAWFTRADRIPAEARPHMRRALARWGLAMLCFALAAAAGALSSTLA